MKEIDDDMMNDLIETLTCVFEDYMSAGESPVLIASVMFAVAVKNLRNNLDDDEFYAILDEIRDTSMLEDEIKIITTEKRLLH